MHTLPSPATAFPPSQAQVHQLSNGLTVLLDPDPDSGLISTQLWVETGSQHESALAGSGVSHFLEHLVFKGTREHTGDVLSQRVQAAGGQWNAYTSFDRTVYYISGPATSWPIFLNALIGMGFYPQLPEKDFELEREVIHREMAMSQDDPGSRASELLFSTFYRLDPRRFPVLGLRPLFDNLTIQDLRTYHAARYRPTHAFLSVAGTFEPTELLNQLEAELTHPLTPRPEFALDLPSENPGWDARRARQPFELPASLLTLAWQIPGLHHPDTPALELLAQVLGHGRSSPLYRQLREERHLALEISASTWSPARGPGMLAIHAETPPEHVAPLEEAISQVLQALPEQDLTQALHRARRQSFRTQLSTLQTVQGRATDLASNWHEARHPDFTRQFLNRLEDVTPQDLLDVATRWLQPQNLTLTELHPPEKTPAAPELITAPASRSTLREARLSNGLRVLIERDSRVPLASLQLITRTGCHAETAQTAGINRLLAALSPKATTSHPAPELATLLENQGARLHASAGNNSSQLSLSGFGADLPQLLPLFSEVACQPLLEAQDLARERQSHLTDLQEQRLDPLSRAFYEVRHGLWGAQGYGLSPGGTIESVTRLTTTELQAHHLRYHTAPNAVLAAFGDLDEERLLAQLEDAFSPLPSVGTPPPEPLIPTQSGELNLELPKEQAVLALGYPAVGATDPAQLSVSLLDSFLSDMAGPLFTRLREELGLVYYVNCRLMLGVGTGLWVFYLGCAPEQMAAAEDALRQEIEKARREPLPSTSFQAAVQNLQSATLLSLQRPSQRAQQCALDTLLGLSPQHHQQLATRIQSLRSDEVFAHTHDLLSAKPFVVRIRPTSEA